jgi:hypothetical protein
MSGASVATAVALAIEFASPIPIPGLISGIVTSITGVGSSQIHSKIAAKNNYAELQDILNNWYRGQQSMLVDSIFEEMYIKPLEEKVAGIKGINFTEVKKALRTIRVELEVNRSIDEGIPHI